jgi:hypothetical protein
MGCNTQKMTDKFAKMEFIRHCNAHGSKINGAFGVLARQFREMAKCGLCDVVGRCAYWCRRCNANYCNVHFASITGLDKTDVTPWKSQCYNCLEVEDAKLTAKRKVNDDSDDSSRPIKIAKSVSFAASSSSSSSSSTASAPSSALVAVPAPAVATVASIASPDPYAVAWAMRALLPGYQTDAPCHRCRKLGELVVLCGGKPGCVFYYCANCIPGQCAPCTSARPSPAGANPHTRAVAPVV